MFRDDDEFVTLTCAPVTIAFTVLLPTNNALVFATTFAPTAIAVEFNVDTPEDIPIGVINALDDVLATVTLPTTFALPTTERAASSVEVLTPTRLESPLATNKFVFTT
jgi:hypothetical protein